MHRSKRSDQIKERFPRQAEKNEKVDSLDTPRSGWLEGFRKRDIDGLEKWSRVFYFNLYLRKLSHYYLDDKYTKVTQSKSQKKRSYLTSRKLNENFIYDRKTFIFLLFLMALIQRQTQLWSFSYSQLFMELLNLRNQLAVSHSLKCLQTQNITFYLIITRENLQKPIRSNKYLFKSSN